MLRYNDIIEKKYIDLDGTPYEVISSHVFRKQKQKPVNQTKLKNLLNGKVTEQSFHQSEKVEEAEIEDQEFKYLYNNRGEYWFSFIDDPSQRFSLEEKIIPEGFGFIKENSVVKGILFKDKIIGFKLPIKVKLLVKEAPPAVRGNTAQGADKKITLETGVVVNAPIFIKEGEIVEVNTETGEYSGRSR